jgi:uncharacterized protein (TIGR00730 family)
VDDVFFAVARELGLAIARNGCALVYGGTSVGPMDEVAKAVHAEGGHVIGVIPEHMRGIASAACSELVVEPELHARKARMEELSDAFVCLPGGIGTLDEICETLALRQLGRHDKPVVFVNVQGFFDPLFTLFERFAERRFMKQEPSRLYHVARDAASAVKHIAACLNKASPQD